MAPAEGIQPVDERTRTGLGWLVGARLLLAGLGFGLAVTLDRIEGTHVGNAIWGIYWTIGVAFFATIVSAVSIPHTHDPARFATVQVGIDLTIVSSLVYFSGGGYSVFTFLYALVVLYGALFLDRNGVVFSAGLAALGYGFVLFGSELGWLPHIGPESSPPVLAVLGAYWAFYAAALLMLGMLANTLSAELRRTGAALDRRTTDLRRLRDLHLRTVESITSGLLTLDGTGRVTSMNPEAARITGVSPQQAAGHLLEEIIPGASASIESEGSRSGHDQGNGRDRVAYRNREGDDLFLGLAASSLRDEDGLQVGHVVIFQDVTAVVSMEDELRQSERLAAVGEMAARMAHEIRNPLASISGSVQLLQSAYSTSDTPNTPDSVDAPASVDTEETRLMGIVVREVDRLNVLIGDFLRYSRPAPLKRESVRIADLVDEIAQMSATQSGERLYVDLDLDRDLVVRADPSQLKAVVWNLWNNAVEAMEGDGELFVRLTRLPGDQAQEHCVTGRNGEGAGLCADRSVEWAASLEIEDTGPGIAPDAQEMIFEPFFTTKRDGTGLGLATVQRIVEQHGGTIRAIRSPERGTCFRVLLPCPEADE